MADGFSVELARSGGEALTEVRAGPPDAMVFNLGLPDVNGLEVLKAIRAISPVPTVILPARDDADGKVATLEADDYVTKPVEVGERLARLRTALRHAVRGAGTTAVFAAGDLLINTLAHRVTLRGEHQAS